MFLFPETDILAKIKSDPLICPDNTTCDSLNTCCKMSNDSYGCCPYTNGVCCLGSSFCCDVNHVCGTKIGECLPKKLKLGQKIN